MVFSINTIAASEHATRRYAYIPRIVSSRCDRQKRNLIVYRTNQVGQMTLIDEQWREGSPERAVADAFSAFQRRDLARLAAVATPASIRAVAGRVGSELGADGSRPTAGAKSEITTSDAALTLRGVMERLPELFTDTVRCVIVGRVLESRLVDANADGRGLIVLDCRIAGTEEEWLPVKCDPRVQREIVDHDPGVAHVAFRAARDLPDRGVVPFPPELQMATVQLIDGEWKLVLDEWSDVGLPGFRGIGFWVDEHAATEAGTDERSEV
jgi:hypothetical protein